MSIKAILIKVCCTVNLLHNEWVNKYMYEWMNRKSREIEFLGTLWFCLYWAYKLNLVPDKVKLDNVSGLARFSD